MVFDIECDGLNPTKIHVLSVMGRDGPRSTDDYDKMREFFLNAKVLVGHNIIRYDIPVVEKLLDIKVSARLIDTLSLSWYLEFDRHRHGLEYYGEEYGIKKPEVTDWFGLSYDDYKHRCEQDVEINDRLWTYLHNKLIRLYGSESDADGLIDYLSFKLHCAALQEKSKWKLDVDRAVAGLIEMNQLKWEKINALAKVMPDVPVVSKKTRPKKPYKQDGTLSATGKKWEALTSKMNLTLDYDGVIEVRTSSKPPNPGSHQQIKDWLYDLGWKPETHKYKRDKKTGDVRQIPQINLEHGEGICPSIKKLYGKEPQLELLDGLSVLTHRISILTGFLKAVDSEGYVKAEVQGITNTMRFKHAVCVNLPGVDKPYGELVRGCLIAPKGYELCGSDMCSLEQTTKLHYMWKFDKKYVKEMMADGFDSHLDLAKAAGKVTEDQVAAHGRGDEDHSAVRKLFKAVNYGSVYGAGGATIARSAGVSVAEGKKLVEAYWKRNWAVKAIPKTITTKVEFGSMWLLNPVSKLWYPLRHEKDVFSTLNQGTGTYCFDTWVKVVLDKRPQLTGQFHDEIILTIKKGHREGCEKLLKSSIVEANRQLRLNLPLDISVDFGDCYAEIH